MILTCPGKSGAGSASTEDSGDWGRGGEEGDAGARCPASLTRLRLSALLGGQKMTPQSSGLAWRSLCILLAGGTLRDKVHGAIRQWGNWARLNPPIPFPRPPPAIVQLAGGSAFDKLQIGQSGSQTKFKGVWTACGLGPMGGKEHLQP